MNGMELGLPAAPRYARTAAPNHQLSSLLLLRRSPRKRNGVEWMELIQLKENKLILPFTRFILLTFLQLYALS